MFIYNWFWDVLSYLHLWNKSGTILFLGLDNAGKTTLLSMLKENRLVHHEPTLHPTMEVLQIGQIRFNAHDLGGHKQARTVWQDYFTKVDGIVFIVDAADPERFEEAKAELNALLTQDKSLEDVPFCILGNKIDVVGAVSEDELRNALGVHHLSTGKGKVALKDIRPMEVFMCSVAKRMGYAEAFQWLSQYI